MKKYYVSGKYDGVDIGMEVEAQNQYMAAYYFIGKSSLKLGVGMKRMFIDRTSDYFNLAIEYGEIINQYQDKVVALQQENKRLKREIWNLKKTKGKRK